eukprot:5170821-Prymnesium_polylepis.1
MAYSASQAAAEAQAEARAAAEAMAQAVMRAQQHSVDPAARLVVERASRVAATACDWLARANAQPSSAPSRGAAAERPDERSEGEAAAAASPSLR